VKILRVMLIGLLILGLGGCKKKPEVNTVDLEQVNPDDSNDYRYIFREEIQKDKDREDKRLKKEFNGRRP
jgi:hypothetical protein